MTVTDDAPAPALGTRDILGVSVVSGMAEPVTARIVERFEAGIVQKIAFINSNLMVTLGDEAPTLLGQFMVLNDGFAVDVAAWLLGGSRFPDNLNGTDLTPRILRALPPGAKVFLYGARPGVAARAADRFARDGVTICGHLDGYGGAGAEAARAAREAGAEVVLVALGNPRQERWIVEHGADSGARLLIGVGALFDFMSGAVKRAPRPFQILRLEWLYRLLGEPGRLGRRYTVEMGRFFALVLRERRRKRRTGGRRRP